MRDDMDRIETLIRSRIEEDFTNVPIVRVDVKPDTDEDGEDILWVRVIFDGQPADLDRRAVLKSIGRLRDVLEDIDVYDFPVISFASLADVHAASSA
ncbi:hypothetical protein SAMN06297251_102225 [Fulvimarina manganoxydans]|uniref:Ribosome-binding factor A n=1 Tax=Fulvimarina manganoxydans TaxID=937218 RepID=A0A1W1Z7Y7_9HYPH|nr:hypothetical protein [Fulvimarina manganoxydans]MEE2952994.1 hypothetical protein [Pseudomonadota bacterium]SMC44028.1 hypothetical protein SAMN06297251_102225 [Fulvimarina manganoxydans]